MSDLFDLSDTPGLIGRITPIHDLDDPRVGVYRNQKDAWLRAPHNPDPGPPGAGGTGGGGGLFMAEGALVVEQLLGSAYPVESVLVGAERIGALAGLLGRVPAGVPVYGASRGVMGGIVGFDMHRGLLACGRRQGAMDAMGLARSCRALVVLEDLSNHDNLGSVFRSVAVLGGRGVGVLLSPRCCDPLYRKALRVSMGHALRVPFARVDEWPDGLGSLAGLGYSVLALDPGGSAEPIDHVEVGEKVALVFGAEGPGLSDGVRGVVGKGGRGVRIPQAAGADSLNIAVAASVAIHRLIRPD